MFYLHWKQTLNSSLPPDSALLPCVSDQLMQQRAPGGSGQGAVTPDSSLRTRIQLVARSPGAVPATLGAVSASPPPEDTRASQLVSSPVCRLGSLCHAAICRTSLTFAVFSAAQTPLQLCPLAPSPPRAHLACPSLGPAPALPGTPLLSCISSSPQSITAPESILGDPCRPPQGASQPWLVPTSS